MQALAKEATPIEGLANLGFPAYETADGSAVFQKDSFILQVDATDLPATLGPDEHHPERPGLPALHHHSRLLDRTPLICPGVSLNDAVHERNKGPKRRTGAPRMALPHNAVKTTPEDNPRRRRVSQGRPSRLSSGMGALPTYPAACKWVTPNGRTR